MDGLNDARAMRIAEVLDDYRQFQSAIAAYQANLNQITEGTTGHTVLRQCLVEAAALLNIPFTGGNISMPVSPGEGTKKSLQRILLDASTRRFRAYRLYQRAAAAIRWSQRRDQVLHGSPPTSAHQQALGQIDNALRQEIIAVTDQRVYHELNQRDTAAGNWTGEMPTLAHIVAFFAQLH